MNTRTFKFRIVLLFLLMSVPAVWLSVAASYTNFLDAQKRVISARQNSMKMVVRQYDMELEAVDGYLQELLYNNNSYSYLQLEESETRYQQSSIWLIDDLNSAKNYFPLLSGFYIRIYHNGEIYMARDSSVSLEAQDYMEEQIPLSCPADSPCILNFEGTFYLLSAWANHFMEIGYIVSLENLAEQFQDPAESGDVIAVNLPRRQEQYLLSPGADPDRPGGKMLEEPFSTADMTLQLYYSGSMGKLGLSFWERMVILTSVMLLVMFPIFWILIRKWFLLPMGRISFAMQEILRGKNDYRIQEFSSMEEFRGIEQAFNSVLDHSRDLKIRAYELENEKERERLINLKLQINPHLLLNSLNTISSLAVTGKTEAIQEFSVNLSRYFRYALRDTAELVTLQSEIDFIKVYNKVQKIRYPNAFYILYDVDEELMGERIPPLIIQNFVENSTKYALKPDEEIEIMVTVQKEDRMLHISICDNGRGIDPEQLAKIRRGEVICDRRGQHIGIVNSKNRLRRIYGEAAGIRISSERGTGTEVCLDIPCSEALRETEEEAPAEYSQGAACGGDLGGKT